MTDVVLIGAGIMSATLGTFLQELVPNVRITLFERLDHGAPNLQMPGTMPVPAMQLTVSSTTHTKRRRQH